MQYHVLYGLFIIHARWVAYIEQVLFCLWIVYFLVFFFALNALIAYYLFF